MNGDKDRKLRLMRREYGKVMIDDGCFTLTYWLVNALILWIVGASGVVRQFFVPEVIVPLVVGLLGLFIALRLANRERNKRITENYFYKLHVLDHIWRMLDDISAYLGEWENISSESKGDANVLYSQKIEKWINSTRDLYDRHGTQIKVLNTNTSVPADIRHRVLQFVRTGGIAITNYHPRKQSQSNIVAFKMHLLDPLDNLLDVEYFVEDRNEDVKSLLKHANSSRRTIREKVDKWGNKSSKLFKAID